MALRQREKTMVGALLIAGGLGTLMLVALPQWDNVHNQFDGMSQLSQEIDALRKQKTTLSAEIEHLQTGTALPANLIIRSYTENNREAVIKQMLDGVLSQATGTGNHLISLAPYTADPLPGTGAKTAASSTPAPVVTGEKPVESSLLSTFGYEMAIRGSYDSILRFLQSLDMRNELLEIRGIKLENEAGPDRGAAAVSPDAVPPDPKRPIKLTAKLRLVLKPDR